MASGECPRRGERGTPGKLGEKRERGLAALGFGASIWMEYILALKSLRLTNCQAFFFFFLKLPVSGFACEIKAALCNLIPW
jgi:hypothetical protein